MAKKETKYVLPDMEYRFSLQMQGEESKINWTGEFMYRRPTLREQGLIEVLTVQLCQDLVTIDPDIRAFNEALAHLRHTLKEYPDWWKDTGYGGDLYDANVVLHIYEKVLAFEAEWRKRVHGGKKEDVMENANENQDDLGAAP